MPGDLVYHTYVDAQGKPRIDPGPLLLRGERTAYHDVDALVEQVRPGVVAWEQLNTIGAAIQQGVDMDRLVLAGARPRGMSRRPRSSPLHERRSRTARA